MRLFLRVLLMLVIVEAVLANTIPSKAEEDGKPNKGSKMEIDIEYGMAGKSLFTYHLTMENEVQALVRVTSPNGYDESIKLELEPLSSVAKKLSCGLNDALLEQDGDESAKSTTEPSASYYLITFKQAAYDWSMKVEGPSSKTREVIRRTAYASNFMDKISQGFPKLYRFTFGENQDNRAFIKKK